MFAIIISVQYYTETLAGAVKFKKEENEKEKVFDLFILPFFSFVCVLLSQSSMVEGTWVLASDKPCISQSVTLG